MTRKFSFFAHAALALGGIGWLTAGYTQSGGASLEDGPLLAQAAPPQQQQQPQQQAPPTPQQRVENLKAWMAASQAQLRGYEWIETTVVLSKGEEKSRKQNTCYYGADGKVQKVPVGDAAEEKSGGPPGVLIPGKILKKGMAKKKEELTAYMKSAVELVRGYVPPDPARIQRSLASGKMAANMLEPNRRVRLDFGDYLKTGDKLSIEMELPTNRLLGMQVFSYLDSPEDPVQLNVAMSVLPDGTIYTASTILNAAAKDLTVRVENSGYRRVAR